MYLADQEDLYIQIFKFYREAMACTLIFWNFNFFCRICIFCYSCNCGATTFTLWLQPDPTLNLCSFFDWITACFSDLEQFRCGSCNCGGNHCCADCSSAKIATSFLRPLPHFLRSSAKAPAPAPQLRKPKHRRRVRPPQYRLLPLVVLRLCNWLLQLPKMGHGFLPWSSKLLEGDGCCKNK